MSMGASDFVLGYRKLSDDPVKDLMPIMEKHEETDEDIMNAKLLKIFQTSRQKTWLVATTNRLYCILDDVRHEKPNLKWSILKSELDENAIINRREGQQTLVDIGPKHKNWLYSADLFFDKTIKQAIGELL